MVYFGEPKPKSTCLLLSFSHLTMPWISSGHLADVDLTQWLVWPAAWPAVSRNAGFGMNRWKENLKIGGTFSLNGYWAFSTPLWILLGLQSCKNPMESNARNGLLMGGYWAPNGRPNGRQRFCWQAPSKTTVLSSFCKKNKHYCFFINIYANLHVCWPCPRKAHRPLARPLAAH